MINHFKIYILIHSNNSDFAILKRKIQNNKLGILK